VGLLDIAPVVDAHQHIWPAALVEALRARRKPPRLIGWELHLDGEPPYNVKPNHHDLSARHAIDEADGVDLALLSLSSPLGIESLPPDEARPLLAAWHAFADAIGPEHGLWAAPQLVDPDLGELCATLHHTRVHGLQVPATTMTSPAALEQLTPVLAVAEQAGMPVLIHPGPTRTDQRGAAATAAPGWWPALTDYPAQLAAAWFAWHVAGRALLPSLRIAFVALAGLAPLHHERLAQRGGTLGRIDPSVHYETSSYGPRAIDAVVRVVGVDALIHGSDRPYAEPTDPGLGDAFSRALYVANPAHLLTGGTR
jgi:hypothetical protein